MSGLTEVVLSIVKNERKRQDEKWGVQNHSIEWWVAILGEEYGEFCQCVNEWAIKNNKWSTDKDIMKHLKEDEATTDAMVKELVHTAAVAVNAIECLFRNKYSADNSDDYTPKEIGTLEDAELEGSLEGSPVYGGPRSFED